MSCILEICNVQCNRALICTLIMCYYKLQVYKYHLLNKSQCRRFSPINTYIPCNLIWIFLWKLANVENIFGPLWFCFEQVLLYMMLCSLICEIITEKGTCRVPLFRRRRYVLSREGSRLKKCMWVYRGSEQMSVTVSHPNYPVHRTNRHHNQIGKWQCSGWFIRRDIVSHK
jgi:hypothetical protein